MVQNLNAEQQAEIAAARAKAIEEAGKQFAALDANGDGTVEKAELIAFAKAQAPKGVGEPTEAQKQAAEAQLTQMIAQFDSDKDGKVSKEEWNAFFGNVFDTTVAASLQHQP